MQTATNSATIVVASKLTVHPDSAWIHPKAPESVRKSLMPTIDGLCAHDPQMQRVLPIRQASLAASLLLKTTRVYSHVRSRAHAQSLNLPELIRPARCPMRL